MKITKWFSKILTSLLAITLIFSSASFVSAKGLDKGSSEQKETRWSKVKKKISPLINRIMNKPKKKTNLLISKMKKKVQKEDKATDQKVKNKIREKIY